MVTKVLFWRSLIAALIKVGSALNVVNVINLICILPFQDSERGDLEHDLFTHVHAVNSLKILWFIL